MAFERLSLEDRLMAVNTDIMRDPNFCLFSGAVLMGKNLIVDNIPTACTDGEDKLYGRKFVEILSRPQFRYVALHECGHVLLMHCVLYTELWKKHPKLCNVAADYVVNGIIEMIDPNRSFAERPPVPVLYDKKYEGWSFPEVFEDLYRQAQQQPQGGGGGGGQGFGTPMDEHRQTEKTGQALEDLQAQVEAAAYQGQLMASKAAGNTSADRDIAGTLKPSQTHWREYVREWLQTINVGDEYSSYNPPNKRLMAAGIIMPRHFDEATGEVVVAVDTSGSMHPYYGVTFGEIVRLVEQLNPSALRLLWWDTEVCGDQVFAKEQFENLASQLAPRGGGGTTPTCVVEYIHKKKITPAGVIWLTDGYLGCDTPPVECPALWGVINNTRFQASHGVTVHIKT